MNKTLLPIILLALSGCATDKQAEVDSQSAIKQGDYRLLQMPGRGSVVPGIESAERQQAIELCGVKIVEGVSDVVRNVDELEKVQLLTQYATEYNLQVYQECKNAKQ